MRLWSLLPQVGRKRMAWDEEAEWKLVTKNQKGTRALFLC